MAAFKFVRRYGLNQGRASIDLENDTFKAALATADPDEAEGYGDITEVVNGNGYTTGGVTLTSVGWDETSLNSGISQFDCADFGWTATGGSIVFRYIVIYSDTATGKEIVGYVDAGTDITVASGFDFTLDVGANGVFRVGSGSISI